MEKQFDFTGLGTEAIVFPAHSVLADIKIQKLTGCFTEIHGVQ